MKQQIIIGVIAAIIATTAGFIWLIILKKIRSNWDKVKLIALFIISIFCGFVWPIGSMIYMYNNEPLTKQFVLHFAWNFALIVVELMLIIAGIVANKFLNRMMKDDDEFIKKQMENIKKIEEDNFKLDLLQQRLDAIKSGADIPEQTSKKYE